MSASSVVDDLGYLNRNATYQSADVRELTVKQNPVSFVLIGTTGDLSLNNRGATGVHNVYKYDTTTALTIPAGYTVYRVDMRIPTALSPVAGTPTISVGTDEKADAFNSAEAITSLVATNDSLLICDKITPHTVRATSAETATYTVASNALNAGTILFYYNIFAST